MRACLSVCMKINTDLQGRTPFPPIDLRTHPLIETLSKRLKTAEKYMSVFFAQFKEKYDCESWAYFFFCLNISRTFSPLFFRFSPFFFRFFAFFPFLSFQLICSFFARISQLREEYIILAILGSSAQIFLILQKWQRVE